MSSVHWWTLLVNPVLVRINEVLNMNVIMGLQERQREKQLNYERRLLRDLSIEKLKVRILDFFNHDYSLGLYLTDVLEEGCFDVAIEAFLLGGNYGKFGYYGESMEDSRLRCKQEEKYLVDTLFNYILYWGKAGKMDIYSESLFYHCSAYVETWWLQGFQAGAKYYKLRLH